MRHLLPRADLVQLQQITVRIVEEEHVPLALASKRTGGETISTPAARSFS